MDETISWGFHVGFLVVGIGVFAGMDLPSRGSVGALWLLALGGASAVWIGLLLLTEPLWVGARGPRYLELELQQIAAVGLAIAAGVGAFALAASRSRRAVTVRWRWWRLLFAVVGLGLVSWLNAVDRSDPARSALWLSWSAMPVALAFARDGDVRLERGARTALGLVWLGAAGWLGSVLLYDGMGFLGALANSGSFESRGVDRLAPWLAWVLLCTTVAVARWPDPKIGWAAVPAILVGLPFWLRAVTMTLWSPGSAAGRHGASPFGGQMPQVVDLAGAPVGHRLGLAIGTDCLEDWDWARCGVDWASRPWPSADTRLAVAPMDWLVYQDVSPGWLGYGVLDVTAPPYAGPRVLVREEGGLAVVNGDVAHPHPLDASLMPALVLPSAAWPRVEIERTPRWTIQDAVSICASVNGGDARCVLVP